MSLRTIIYLRKSTQDKDEKQIHSIPRQQRDIEEFVERYNAVHPPEERLKYGEEDIVVEDASAKYPGRQRFGEMVTAIRKRKYDVLLCTELSRLSRNAVDTGTLVQLLEEGHLKRIQTKDKTFGATPTDKFTLGLFLMVSKFENDQRALNTQSGMYNQKMKGETTHRASMGYINCGTEKGRKWVEQDPLTWDSVRRVWDMMLTGNYAITDLKREGDAMGITIAKGDRREMPHESAYRYMFSNKYYAGYVKVTDRETGTVQWVKGKHPDMVTEEEFDRVQLILQGRGYKHQKLVRPASIESILNEILVCGKCFTETNGVRRPTKMMFEQKRRITCENCGFRYSSAEDKPCPQCSAAVKMFSNVKVHRYYRCCKKHASKSCSHDFKGDGNSTKSLPAEVIEQYLDERISRLHITDKLFVVLKRQLYTLWLQDNENMAKQRTRIREDIRKLEQERVKIMRQGLDKDHMNDVEREDHEHLLDDNRTQQEALEEQLEMLRNVEVEQYERAWQTLQALTEAKSVLNSPDLLLAPKRNLILSMVSHLKITDNKMEIEWKKPFDVVANAAIAKNGKNQSGIGSDGGKFNWLPRLDSNQRPWR